MLMALVAAMGAVNFYCHRAVMEGEGPVFAEIAAAIRRIAGPHRDLVRRDLPPRRRLRHEPVVARRCRLERERHRLARSHHPHE